MPDGKHAAEVSRVQLTWRYTRRANREECRKLG